MKQKMINSQLNNFQSYLNYRGQLCSSAKNTFLYEDMPEKIDMSFVRNRVLNVGSIAFFNDEDLGLGVLALSYDIIGNLDIYGNPNKIRVYSKANGYQKTLEKDEFVILYDNTEKMSLMPMIVQYAERLALCERVIDINLSQQKTPRFWKVPQEKERTIRDMVNNVDGNIEQILTYNDLAAKDIDIVLQPAPFVADKVQIEKEKIYNEFLRCIGISSVNIQKKERLITDEIEKSQGGSIVMRYNRYEPRKYAIDQINKKWGLNIKLKYYDDIPASYEEFEKKIEESEVIKDDEISKELD